MQGYQPLRQGAPVGGLWLPGVNGNYATTPDHADLDITGDLDVRVLVKPDDWTPSATQCVIAKEQTSDQRSWRLELVASTGAWSVVLSGNGSEQVNHSRTPTGLVNGVPQWMRFTWADDTNTVAIWRSSDGETWEQVGTSGTLSLTGGSIFASTSLVGIGARIGGNSGAYKGVVYEAQVRSGIGGTLVANPQFRHPATEFTGTGVTGSDGYRVWTLNGTAWAWRR